MTWIIRPLSFLQERLFGPGSSSEPNLHTNSRNQRAQILRELPGGRRRDVAVPDERRVRVEEVEDIEHAADADGAEPEVARDAKIRVPHVGIANVVNRR